MNTKRNCKFAANVIATPLCLAAIVFLLVVCGSSESRAQGRLRGVSNAIRKNSARPSPPKKTPPKDSSTPKKDRPRKSSPPAQAPDRHDDHEDDHKSADRHDDHGSLRIRYRKPSSRPSQNSHRNRSNHNHRGSRATRIIYVAPHVTHVEPVVFPVVPAYPPMHLRPIVEPLIQQPQPMMNSVLIEQPQYEPANQPVYESVARLPGTEFSTEHIIVEPVVIEDWFQFQTSTLWATIGSDFDGITSGGLGARLQAPASLGLEGSVMTLRESYDGYRDHLWIGDVNLTYEILNRQDVRGRVGLGVNWLSDAWGAETGFNLTGGIDLRVSDRLTLALEGDVGNLGDADFFHARANLARRLESVELMLGVDHFNIGGAEVNSVFTGMQLRF